MPKSCLGVLLTVAVAIGFLSCVIFVIFLPPRVPEIDENIWWGNQDQNQQDESIREFKISVPETVITDLKWRLKHRKPIAPSIGSANQYGVNSKFMEEFLDFWCDKYNWTERQLYLNTYPQFKTNIQGLDIHFLHIKPTTSRKVLPVLLLHGWPGSVREFYETIPFLTGAKKTTFAVELVIPALPGFGFSQVVSKPGFDLVQAAIVMKKLMNRLGFEQFYVQGGDLGGLILQIMSVLYPQSIMGLHTNVPSVYTPMSYIKTALASIYSKWYIKPDHYDRIFPLVRRGVFIFKESGYMHLQSTKPDTLGVGLGDSPAGMAAYYVEKFITGSNFSFLENFDSGKLQEKFSYVNIADNFMYYWVTDTATSSLRIYYESFNDVLSSKALTLLRIPVKVPTVILRAAYDIYMADGVLHEIYPVLLDLNDYDIGHFAAFEAPKLFANDLINALEKFEKYHQEKN